MFNDIKNVFGFVSVEEDETEIHIGGLWTKDLVKDMTKIWKNPKAMSYMFNLTRRQSISFNKFFAVDVFYIFQTIVEEQTRIRSNRYRLIKILELMKTETWIKSMFQEHRDILDYSTLNQLHHELFPHQMETLKGYNSTINKMQLKGFLLAADVGTGKTIMSLALATCLHSDVVIIVCQKSLADNVWYAAIQEEFGKKTSVWSSAQNEKLSNKYKYYIFHYEALLYAVDFCKQFSNKKVCIVLDESHNLNEITSLRTQRFIDLVKVTNSEHTIFASGTAVKALGSEMVPLLTCIDPLFNKDAAERFKLIYGVSAKRAVDILRHRLNLISHKIPKEVVMKIEQPIVKKLSIKIPDGHKYTVDNVKKEMKSYIEDKISFYNKNMRMYDDFYEECVEIYYRTLRTDKDKQELKLYRDYIHTIRYHYDPILHKNEVKYCNEFEKNKIIPALPQKLKQSFKDAKSIVKYVELKVLGEALGNVLLKMRVECNSKMIEYSGLDEIVKTADKKTLCFSSYVEVIQTAEKYFKAAELNPVAVYGDNTKNIDSIITNFKSNPEINPLLATFKSLATGVTLTVCNCCVFFDLPFRDYIREQAAHRIFRIGQDTQCYFYECTLDTGQELNISTKAEEIMEWSKEQVDAILGKSTKKEEFDTLISGVMKESTTPIKVAFKKFVEWFE